MNSARNIFEFIDKERFEPLPIGINKNGQWFLTAGVTADISQGKALGLMLDAQSQGFILLSSGDRMKVDIIFPVLHGTDGEDGSIQGLIKAMDIPMVGTGVLGSSVCMNKIATKRLLQQAGIPVADFITFHHAERESISFKKVKKQLGSPFMVKAANLGSSVGVSKVKDEASFLQAVEESFRYDNHILMEKYIPGRELECAIMGNNPLQASYPGEIVISDKYEFYTFDAKYVDPDAVRIDVPAQLDEKTAEKIRDICIKACQALFVEDFARCDLFLTKEGHIYINEINTIPGFTNSSMFPMMWKERGIEFTELISRLLDIAQERHERSKRIERDYKSSLKF